MYYIGFLFILVFLIIFSCIILYFIKLNMVEFFLDIVIFFLDLFGVFIDSILEFILEEISCYRV